MSLSIDIYICTESCHSIGFLFLFKRNLILQWNTKEKIEEEQKRLHFVHRTKTALHRLKKMSFASVLLNEFRRSKAS